jgi:hypothetical protein
MQFKREQNEKARNTLVKERVFDSAYIEIKDHSFTQRTKGTKPLQYPLVNSL